MRLWFDVGTKDITTLLLFQVLSLLLWFDVGTKDITTVYLHNLSIVQLWFDVGTKDITTFAALGFPRGSCGLM